MILINHRINTIKLLNLVPKNQGVEVDVRYHENDLVLHHDPFNHHENKPENFEDYLRSWIHEGPMIINVKTEGVEDKIIELMNAYKIGEWFFLDLSMPYFVKYSLKTEKKKKVFNSNNLAVRFSEHEPLEYAISFSNKARWVWVDCFSILPLNEDSYQKLLSAGFKICLVSPELQGHSLSKIKEFKKQVSSMNIDAVCSKRPDLWEI